MSNYQVFISYRRDGGEFLAGRISDQLSNSGYSVFYDVESMRAGAFDEQIYKAIDQCADVLLVLPPNGLDRCRDEGDWVRKEIAYALETGKNIIPMMMEGFVFPEELPENISALSRKEGVKVDSHYFAAVLERTCALMQSKPQKVNKVCEDKLKDGIRFLNRRMYAQALNCFESVILDEVSEPSAYFYAVIAKMEGKRPFMLSKAVINELERYMDSAIAYGDCAIYNCLYAYIKQDYYEKKMLRSVPSSSALLQRAQQLGLTDIAVKELFALLGTQKPEGF
ncbi:MAG: toll/interleukin-1 receptor domain-containing protein [Oscillospiraceae bacterium]|nr:toll/interleukin-1 receptor domain-containing protein [Oscillospiraceae bacterium]